MLFQTLLTLSSRSYLIGLPFFPESPVHLIKKGREVQARKAVLKLYGQEADVEGILTIINKELQQEEAPSSGISQTSWKAIFSKENRTRTFVAVLGLQSQNFSGVCKSRPISSPLISSHPSHLISPLSKTLPTLTKPTTSTSSAKATPSN